MFDINVFKDGATLSSYDLKPVLLNKGYVVSITNNVILPENIEIELEFMRKQAYTLGMSVGVWFSEVTNEWFVDLSTIISDKERALELAKRHNQQAIYSYADKACIYIKEAM